MASATATASATREPDRRAGRVRAAPQQRADRRHDDARAPRSSRRGCRRRSPPRQRPPTPTAGTSPRTCRPSRLLGDRAGRRPRRAARPPARRAGSAGPAAARPAAARCAARRPRSFAERDLRALHRGRAGDDRVQDEDRQQHELRRGQQDQRAGERHLAGACRRARRPAGCPTSTSVEPGLPRRGGAASCRSRGRGSRSAGQIVELHRRPDAGGRRPRPSARRRAMRVASARVADEERVDAAAAGCRRCAGVALKRSHGSQNAPCTATRPDDADDAQLDQRHHVGRSAAARRSSPTAHVLARFAVRALTITSPVESSPTHRPATTVTCAQTSSIAASWPA